MTRRPLLACLVIGLFAAACAHHAIRTQRDLRRSTARPTVARESRGSPVAASTHAAATPSACVHRPAVAARDFASRPPPAGFDVPSAFVSIDDIPPAGDIETLRIDLRLERATLGDVVNLLRRAGLDVVLRAESLHEATIDFRGVLVRPVLAFIQTEFGVPCEVRDGVVRIGAGIDPDERNPDRY